MSTRTQPATDDRAERLVAELSYLAPRAGYQFHWVVENRIPTDYGTISFDTNVGVVWEGSPDNDLYQGPRLYNDRNPQTWSSVSSKSGCAQIVACEVKFDEQNKLYDVVHAPAGQCMINMRWTVA